MVYSKVYKYSRILGGIHAEHITAPQIRLGIGWNLNRKCHGADLCQLSSCGSGGAC